MDLRVADTIYDQGMRPWQNNINDLTDYQRAFQAGNGEQRKIAQAMISQNPATPRQDVQRNMTTSKFPPRFGYKNHQSPTIDQILAGQLDNNDTDEWNNFSGSKGEIDSTLRYNGMWW